MPKRTLGQSGLEISAVDLGTDAFGISVDGPTVKKIMSAASDHRITLIDTAYMYGDDKSEEYIGNSIQGRRHDFVIATKDGHPMDGGPARRNLIKEIEVSLKRLKTDHIDLIRYTYCTTQDFPLEEMMQTLNDMVRSDKVRYLGLSNMYSSQLCRCNDLAEIHGWDKIISVQPHYHMFERKVESDLSQYCQWER
ncbi:MAG: hypothetical protein CMP95_04685 [Gammaproteobacteria bacterium]|nr:hypothetical protein [Gammaproteobacteria bacterium]